MFDLSLFPVDNTFAVVTVIYQLKTIITPYYYVFQNVKTSSGFKHQFFPYFHFQFSRDHASLLEQQKWFLDLVESLQYNFRFR